MSERQYTLTSCNRCRRGYRLRDMHDVTAPDGTHGVLCESCYEEWQRESREDPNWPVYRT